MNMSGFLLPFYKAEMISRSGKATKAHFVCFADELKDALFKDMLRHPYKMESGNMSKKVKPKESNESFFFNFVSRNNTIQQKMIDKSNLLTSIIQGYNPKYSSIDKSIKTFRYSRKQQPFGFYDFNDTTQYSQIKSISPNKKVTHSLYYPLKGKHRNDTSKNMNLIPTPKTPEFNNTRIINSPASSFLSKGLKFEDQLSRKERGKNPRFIDSKGTNLIYDNLDPFKQKSGYIKDFGKYLPRTKKSHLLCLAEYNNDHLAKFKYPKVYTPIFSRSPKNFEKEEKTRNISYEFDDIEKGYKFLSQYKRVPTPNIQNMLARNKKSEKKSKKQDSTYIISYKSTERNNKEE